MARKARLEGAAVADPVPGDNGEALERILAFFKAEHGDSWEALKLCPLQHGLEDMIGKLKG